MKKLAALLLCLLMITAVALADIVWPEGQTAGQQQLKDYIGRVNAVLATTGGGQINVLHGMTPRRADLGMNGLELPADETVRIMEEHLKDPAYTPEQKQVFHAVIIGTLRRAKGDSAATQLRSNIMEMKRLAPESNLGVTADQTIKIWLNKEKKK